MLQTSEKQTVLIFLKFFVCCMHCSLTHNASSGAVEASRTEGGWALGVSGQTLRAEKTWGAHHDAQHGFLTSGLITAVVALQAWRTLQRALVLHTREREGRRKIQRVEVKDTNQYGGGTEQNTDQKLKGEEDRTWKMLEKHWYCFNIESIRWTTIQFDFNNSSCWHLQMYIHGE